MKNEIYYDDKPEDPMPEHARFFYGLFVAIGLMLCIYILVGAVIFYG